ncbi:MAG: hypothetical protein LBF84_02965 [Holosporales bacterium]|jgi:hypothetical protein|nr:hypothetical protein [Holosporales bacterium]
MKRIFMMVIAVFSVCPFDMYGTRVQPVTAIIFGQDAYPLDHGRLDPRYFPDNPLPRPPHLPRPPFFPPVIPNLIDIADHTYSSASDQVERVATDGASKSERAVLDYRMTDVAPERPSVPEHLLVPSVTPFSGSGIGPAEFPLQGAQRQHPYKDAVRFTPAADAQLCALVEQYGTHDWRKIASMMPAPWDSRKACAGRWNQCLKPALSKGDFSWEEDAIIMTFVSLYPARWALLHQILLPSRSVNRLLSRYKTITKRTRKYNLSWQEAILCQYGKVVKRAPLTEEELQAIQDRVRTAYEQRGTTPDATIPSPGTGATDDSIESFQERVRIALEHKRENPSLAAIPPELQERARIMRARVAEILGSTAEG